MQNLKQAVLLFQRMMSFLALGILFPSHLRSRPLFVSISRDDFLISLYFTQHLWQQNFLLNKAISEPPDLGLQGYTTRQFFAKTLHSNLINIEGLNIIENEYSLNVLSVGHNYREPCSISWNCN